MSTTPYHVVQVTPLGHRGQTQISFGPLPDECPECHAVATPNKIDAAHAPLSVGCLLYVSFQCPSQKCGAMFVGKYVQSQDNSYALQSVRPRNPKPSVLPECVQKLSPEFVRIYDQALAAETYNLDALTGIGLRKVLEFLVKDFAKQESPGKESETEAEFLGTRIKKYIDDANVKACATRAAFLGNDETHYVRKWGDKDIEDLKRLVHLSVNWIDNTLTTRQYVAEMPASI